MSATQLEPYQNLLVEDHGPVRVLRFNRPRKRNAFSIGLANDFAHALLAADADASVKALVVTAEGEAFSAGADMNIFAGIEQGDVRMVASLHEPLLKVTKPIVAAVNGLAVGMGVTLLPFFDVVYASEKATFKAPFVKLGLVLEYGSSYTLTHLIGRQRTNEMILSGRAIDAATALAWGLVNRVCPAERLLDEAMELAAEIAGNGPKAVAKSKMLIRKGEQSPSFEESMAAELEILSGCYGSEENVKAAMAFLNKGKS